VIGNRIGVQEWFASAFGRLRERAELLQQGRDRGINASSSAHRRNSGEHSVSHEIADQNAAVIAAFS
jgi:hypothetical protein